MKYDFKDLQTFIAVAKLQSFIKAAQALNISKTAITTRIANLEKKLGIILLARTTRVTSLTTDGKIFLEYCENVIKKVEDLDDFIAAKKEVSGVLKIAIPPYFSRYHIVPYLSEFLSKYPKLKLDIALTENPINIISECFDLQIRIQIPSDENLEISKLMTNKKVVCASPKYLQKHGTPKQPRDLLNHNCIIFGENNIWTFQRHNSRDFINLHDMTGNIKCDNGEIVKELVLCGLGITLKSARDIEEEIAQGKLVALLEDYKIIHQTQFYIVYPQGRYLSPKIKAFVDFFSEKLREEK